MGQVSVPGKILFLGLEYSDVAHESGLYVELIEELSRAGSDIRVVAPALDGFRTGLRDEGGVRVLRVPTGELYEANLILKAFSNLLLPVRYFLALRLQDQKWQADWIITPTPPITLTPLVWWLKRKMQARAYLVLRDIFPQNAVDLRIMLRFGPVFGFFRLFEKLTYAVADCIGCMSPANIRYVTEHNSGIDQKKLHLLPNWIAERHVVANGSSAERMREEWGVKESDLLCVFGGNLGKPQQASFLLDVAEALRHDSNIRFVIVGRGSESVMLKEQIRTRRLDNLELRDRLARDDYQRLLVAADVGFILLNRDFTIPNIPSRLMGYWAAGVPVLAATDTSTDLNEAFLAKYGGGDWVKMGDVQGFLDKLRSYKRMPKRLNEMGERGRQAVSQNFTAKKAAEIVLKEMALVAG